MANGFCTECGGNINLGKSPRKGGLYSCHKCGARMVVINLSPLELDLTYDEDVGDWNDYSHYLEFEHGGIKF